MLVKNQMLLKRPWLFALLTAVGVSIAAYRLEDVGFPLRIVGPAIAFALVNLWFFLALRRTRKIQ